MQIFAVPGLVAEPPLGLVAELPQPGPGAPRPILVLGKTREVLTDQRVHRRVSFGCVPANSSQDLLVYA
jgi:hypothetical protein